MNKISIKNMDGTMEEVDLVNAFKINDLNFENSRKLYKFVL